MIDISEITIPKELSGQALKFFKRYLVIIPNVKEQDIPTLQLLAETYGQWQVAMEHIRAEGAVIKCHNGYYQVNSWWRIQKDTSRQLLDLLASFKMSPQSRKNELEDIGELVV